MWGSSTASYQVEGAWNLDGKHKYYFPAPSAPSIQTIQFRMQAKAKAFGITQRIHILNESPMVAMPMLLQIRTNFTRKM